jgi:hypothetical protein
MNILPKFKALVKELEDAKGQAFICVARPESHLAQVGVANPNATNETLEL